MVPPGQFRSPIAVIKFSSGHEMPIQLDPVWQRWLAGLLFTATNNLNEVLDDAILLSFANQDAPTGSIAHSAEEQSLLALLMPDLFRDFSPQISDLQKQVAAIETPRPWPDNDLQVYNALMSREIPQALNTDSMPTFFGLTLTGLTANSFLYSGPLDFLTSTAAPTNGQLLIGSTGASPAVGTIAGTAHQIIVALGAGTIGLRLPQDIDLTSNVEFNNVKADGQVTTSTIAPVALAGLSISVSTNSLSLTTTTSGDIVLTSAGDIVLSPSGSLRMGVFSAAADPPTVGSFPIKDLAGNVRNVACV